MGLGRLSGKICLVGGGGQGMGEALAERLAEEGAELVLADTQGEAVRAAAARLGGDAVGCDVTIYEDCVSAAEFTLARHGRIDVLVCATAVLVSGRVGDMPAESWKNVVDVNLCGTYNMMKAVAPSMLERRNGCIVQINSIAGKRGAAGNSAYAASQFGCIGLVQSLALEFAGRNVRVNAICPGDVLDSPLWAHSPHAQSARSQGLSKEQARREHIGGVPLKKGCTYEDVAGALVFLASDDAAYMTGQAINVTGGQVLH